MSVRVNLLPGDIAAKGQASRTRALAVAAAGGLVVVLGALALLQRQELSNVQAELAAQESVNAGLQADIATLQPFADLEDRATSAADMVIEAMSGEASFAGVLQDLSVAMPPGAEFSTINITASTAPLAPSAGGERTVYGTVDAAGQAVGLVPGVERLLIDFGRVASFDNVFVPVTTTDVNGITTFTLQIELGPEIQTRRYVVDGQEQE